MPEERQQLKLHDLKPAPGSRKKRIRVGRGEGGRRGKTAGRGTKGLKARSKLRPGFEGGQTPLARRLPKLPGFTPLNKDIYNAVNVGSLAAFGAGSTITPDDLRARGLAKARGKVKILGDGELDHALTVQAHAFSASARSKIEAAGGTAETIG